MSEKGLSASRETLRVAPSASAVKSLGLIPRTNFFFLFDENSNSIITVDAQRADGMK